MPRTKHAVLIVALLIGVLLLGLVFVSAFWSPFSFETTGNPAFSEVDTTYSSSVYEESTREEARLSLLDKLGKYVRETIAPSPDATKPEEELVPLEESREGALVLGDARISEGPKHGYVFSCDAYGVSPSRALPWIDEGVWFKDAKAVVSGSVPWTSVFEVTSASGTRTIVTNGLPKHTTGIYPIAVNDPAYEFDTNPNTIRAQSFSLSIPATPTLALSPSCVPRGPIGFTLSGAALFNALDGNGQDAVAHEVQDMCGGHPDPTGTYHYHGESECIRGSGVGSILLGYALDGFGIYASIEGGNTLTNDDLDACHGHVHTIEWDERQAEMYHYHMTDEYPYSVGCFMGTKQGVSKGVQKPPPVPVTIEDVAPPTPTL